MCTLCRTKNFGLSLLSSLSYHLSVSVTLSQPLCPSVSPSFSSLSLNYHATSPLCFPILLCILLCLYILVCLCPSRVYPFDNSLSLSLVRLLAASLMSSIPSLLSLGVSSRGSVITVICLIDIKSV